MSRMVSPYRHPERAAGHQNAEAIMPVNGSGISIAGVGRGGAKITAPAPPPPHFTPSARRLAQGPGIRRINFGKMIGQALGGTDANQQQRASASSCGGLHPADARAAALEWISL